MVLLAAAMAAAADRVEIEAAVSDDLRTVHGTMVVPAGMGLVDPLSLLPEPPTDRDLLRTYPGRPSKGGVEFGPPVDGVVTFTATLPKRYGAIGSTRHGLFASGGWYPQPTGLPILDWHVVVHLPEGTGGALGSTVGTSTLTWNGLAERAPLAVVAHPRTTVVTTSSGADLTLLTRGKPRRTFTRELVHAAGILEKPLTGAIVEGPLRRRLVRPAPGLLYVSDRAFRTTGGTQFVHRDAVTRGLAEAFAPLPDPYLRSLAGAAFGALAMERMNPKPSEILAKIDWLPYVDHLLASRNTAFFSDVVGTAWPGDPVRDDLTEMLAPFAPGRAVLAQTDDRYGAGTGLGFGRALEEGLSLEDAADKAGIDPAWLLGWRRSVPPQDYRLAVDADTVTVTREAPPDAPHEVVVLEVDDRPIVLDLPPGRHEIPVARPFRRSVLDPGYHTEQLARVGDSWPPRYTATFIVRISEIDLTQKQITFGAQATLRREGNTRSLWIASLNHTTVDIVSLGVGLLLKRGPLLDAFNRLHRFRFDVTSSYLNSNFAPSNDSRTVADVILAYYQDNRTNSTFPLRGHRFGVTGGFGGNPGSSDIWASASTQAIGVASVGPRFALAGRASAAIARSDIAARLLILGGAGQMRSIPELPACPRVDDEGNPLQCVEVATERAHTAVEARCALIRGWSVPFLLAWGSELQLAVGLEAEAARLYGGGDGYAVGATVGLIGAGDVLGMEEMPVGIGAAWALWTDGISFEPSPAPQVVLRFGQAF